MWYNKVVQDLSNIPDFIAFYEAEMIAAKRDVAIVGRVEQRISDLPANRAQI